MKYFLLFFVFIFCGLVLFFFYFRKGDTVLTKRTYYVIQNIFFIFKKSLIQETKHLSTDANSSSNNTFFWKTEKIIPNAKPQKRLKICQNQRYALQKRTHGQTDGQIKNSKANPDMQFVTDARIYFFFFG